MVATKSITKIDLLRFPNELILEIADKLDLSEVNRLRRTCRYLATLLDNYMYVRDVHYHAASSFFWACCYASCTNESKYETTARRALAVGADVNMVWNLRRYPLPEDLSWEKMKYTHISPLGMATMNNNTQMAELLVDAGADINLAPCPGFSPIILAVWNKREVMVEYLLEKKVDLRVSSPGKAMGLLALAVSADHKKPFTEFLPLLLPFVDDAEETGYTEATALHNSLLYRDWRALELLPKRPEVDPNQVCRHIPYIGYTPLTQACYGNDLESVKLLCAGNRTDINFVDGNDQSPLSIAIDAHHFTAALYLLELGRYLEQDTWFLLFSKACSSRGSRVDQAMQVAKKMIERVEMTREVARSWSNVARQELAKDPSNEARRGLLAYIEERIAGQRLFMDVDRSRRNGDFLRNVNGAEVEVELRPPR